MRPPVMVPMMEVFFSRMGLIECCMELMDPLTEVESAEDKSSNGKSVGGAKPDLYFSTTILES